MLARLCAFVIWALVAGTVVFWGLRLSVRSVAAPGNVSTVEPAAARGDLTRLFGSAPPPQPVAVAAPPAESTRFKLSGLMSPRQTGSYGVALIAVDGKPARAFRVGARVEGQMTLQSVSLRSAAVGPAGAAPSFTLELPALPPPATGAPPLATNVDLGFAPPAGGQPPPQALSAPQLVSDQVDGEVQQAPGGPVSARQMPGRQFSNTPPTNPAAQR